LQKAEKNNSKNNFSHSLTAKLNSGRVMNGVPIPFIICELQGAVNQNGRLPSVITVTPAPDGL
jgi:hypothetical protein